jgi:hypothetical protein
MQYRETAALQRRNVLVASFSLIFFDPMNFHRTALINCLGSSTCTSLHLAVSMATERNARKISEFIDYECDQHDGVSPPPEEEYPGTPVNNDSGDDAERTTVESPTKRARSTTDVTSESVDVNTATNVPPPPSQPPAPTGATTTLPTLRLNMTHKLIEKASDQQAFEVPTEFFLGNVETIGKTTKVGTYNFTKGTKQCDSFAVVARVVPDPFTGMQHSASSFVMHRTRHHCATHTKLCMPMCHAHAPPHTCHITQLERTPHDFGCCR